MATVKVSVLMPSRGRPELARQSIDSLGHGNFEVLVYLDKDDTSDYNLPKDIRIFKRDRQGYQNFHVMVNYLAKRAKGDWLMLWNDDALMQSTNWLEAIPETIGPMVINFGGNPEVNLFPVVSRSMYEVMGHFSLSTHCDSWVQDIANKVGIHILKPEVSVKHLRETINDDTKQTTQALYAVTSPEFLSAPMQKLLQEDVKKIRKVYG